MNPILEVCTGNLASVEAAAAGGAQRIELCEALPLDGLTPSLELLQQVRQQFPQLTVHVLIRPRAGNFVYTPGELLTMVACIRAALPWCDGIVSGALTPQGLVDLEATRQLVEAAAGKPFTFHRAFDRCVQPLEALEQLIALGCHRVLTSGQAPTALQGAPLLHQLVRQAAGRIIVMPGGGVTASNAHQILTLTGATEIHGSASHKAPAPASASPQAAAPASASCQGAASLCGAESKEPITSAQEVKSILQAINTAA